MRDFGYCDWDGEPAIWSPGEAWVFRKGNWVRVNSAVVGHSARPMAEADFRRMFGNLPPPPKTALKSGDDASKARS
jgi:hypothetical protein